jgi:hypothetical protein
MNIDTETDMNMELGTFAKHLIWRNSRYYTVRIVSDMSWLNFQQRYILVAPLHDVKNDRQIFKYLYCHKGVLSKQCFRGIGNISMVLKKGRYKRHVQYEIRRVDSQNQLQFCISSFKRDLPNNTTFSPFKANLYSLTWPKLPLYS